MTPDSYAEPDPLAEVFPGTADAPLPQWTRSRAVQEESLLWPADGDDRWKPRRKETP